MPKTSKSGCLKKIVAALGMALVLLGVFIYFYVIFPVWGAPFNAQRHGCPPITPPWALECWLWEDDHNTADFTLELLNGYLEHDFPVRTILIDSPWSLRYNDFKVDETRFPNPQQFFSDLQQRGIRVVLWMTCMVDSYSKDPAIQDSSDWFQEAANKGYVVGKDFQINWWKGRGGLVDYTNPEAMAWWHGMQDQVFHWGIDGWKLDGTATYFSSKIGPLLAPYQRTHKGWMTMRGYMDHYYRDEYQYGLTKNPEFITLARAIDSPLPMAHPEGFAPIDASTVNWVGDNKHRWEDDQRGLQRALYCILKSAEKGYNVVGSDVAGYHGGGDIPPNLYIRWAQFSAFCGLFMNGGHEERRMWLRSPQELEIIRTFSWLHTELVPYMYTHVVDAHFGGKPLMRPVAGKYHYLFGDDFLVAPIYEEKEDVEITLPKGAWRYWFNDKEVIEGPKTFEKTIPINEYPVFVREGAIIPMKIARAYTGLGDRDWENYLTLNIYPRGKNTITVHHTDNSGDLKATVDTNSGIMVALEGVVKPHILRLFVEKKPAGVKLGGQALSEGTDWTYQQEKNRVVIRSDQAAPSTYMISF